MKNFVSTAKTVGGHLQEGTVGGHDLEERATEGENQLIRSLGPRLVTFVVY